MCQMERLQSNFVCQRGVESLTGIPVAISRKKSRKFGGTLADDFSLLS